MSVLKIKDAQGNWVGVPQIKGDTGPQGPKGDSGTDGISPTVTITPITGGHRITITDADGEHSADVMDGTGNVDDVQINGTSIVEDGVANVPKSDNQNLGVVKPVAKYGTSVNSNGEIYIVSAYDGLIKQGTQEYRPIVPYYQEYAIFYGLAKAAGHDEKNSTLPMGEYTEDAKVAIQKMLGIYEAPWELIEDFTLEEAGTFDKTAEPDGTPYNFRQVFIKVTYAASLETVASGYGLYYFYDENNNDLLAETGRYAQNTAQMFKHIFLQKNANMATLMHTRITSVGSYAMVYNKSQGVRIPFGNITRIRTNGTEPMGARIQIYAQRAY